MGLVAPCMWDLSSPTRDQTRIPCIGRWILTHWTAREVLRENFLKCHPSALWSLEKVSTDPAPLALALNLVNESPSHVA